MKRLLAGAAAVLAAAALTLNGAGTAASAPVVCKPTWTIGVGGFTISAQGTGQNSSYIPSDQPVGYDSLSINAGAAELDRLFREHRAACPGDHIKMLGHSGGAAVVHVWVSRNRFEPNATAILVADPKRAAGPGSAGIAGNPLAVPADLLGLFRGASGVDANFGPFPVLTICNSGDWVCNEEAGLHGYLYTGVHGNYDLNPWHYPNFARGQDFRNIY